MTDAEKCVGANPHFCPIGYALDFLGGKWVLQVICALNKESAVRFGELKRRIPNISNLMLSRTLKELQDNGLVERIQYNEMPLRVEYSLTEAGGDILPFLTKIAHWGLKAMTLQGQECVCQEQCYLSQHPFLFPSEMEEASQYPEYWDEQYACYGQQLQSDEMRSLSGIERLKWFLKSMLGLLTMGEMEEGHKALVYLFGIEEPNIIRHTRPHYVILESLINECKDEGSISRDFPPSFLVDLLIKIIDGTQIAVLMDSKMNFEENAASLLWFVDNLRYVQPPPTE